MSAAKKSEMDKQTWVIISDVSNVGVGIDRMSELGPASADIKDFDGVKKVDGSGGMEARGDGFNVIRSVFFQK